MMPASSTRSYAIAAALIGLNVLAAMGAVAADSDRAHDHPPAGTVSSAADVRRSEAEYVIPKVNLTRDDGKTVDLMAELNDGRPVLLNFIYTSCTTICPLSSQVFEQFQENLGAEHEPVHLVSISIDPEQDTPARLRAYASQFHAKAGWDHYSGTVAAVQTVQKAFNAYRGDKMSHTPLTLVRAAPGKPWVRFDGFARADDLTAERRAWSAEAAAAALVAR